MASICTARKINCPSCSVSFRREEELSLPGPFKPAKEPAIPRDQIEANRDSNSGIVPLLCFTFRSPAIPARETAALLPLLSLGRKSESPGFISSGEN